ncbi:TonB-dependent siderophore receptor [Herbaspirillum autotrophicum]|uniref:TonB-dependent siderophore receptor n=1 Tax=Herbaspirillum autotrophicum TaxID=180195 RepID=UPI00067B6018|nr:TonB-dependent siderophore receptor [Herbaspirillum autotrophicum]
MAIKQYQNAGARRTSLAITICTATAFMGLGPALTTAVHAAPVSADEPLKSAATKNYNIAPGPLGNVLAQFAALAGVQLSFDAALATVQSPGLNGVYTVQSGFAQLLRNTGHELVDLKDGSFTVRKSAPLQASSLPHVLVSAAAGKEDVNGPVNGLLARRSATGTKTDTAIIDIPQSISVVGRQQMEEQKARTIQDALGYSAGLMTGISAKSPLFDDTLSIRGFEANPQLGSYYRDGMRYMVNLYNGKQEIYGLERIEVLRGPSSILYGAAAPGGIINTVTKRPPATPLHEINLEYGSNQRKQISGDFGGPLDDDGVWSYRLTALKRESGTSMNYGRDDRTYIAPALTWRPNAMTSLTLLGSYQQSDSIYPPALPLTGSLLANRNGQLGTSTFLGEPNLNRFETNTGTFAYLFEHAFSDTLKLRHSLRYYQSDLTLRYTLLTGDVAAANQRLVPRSARGYDDETGILTTDTSLEQSFDTGPVRHTVLAGADFTRASYDSVRTRGNLPAINAFNPVYLTTPVTLGPYRSFRTEEKKLGLYLQDQLKLADKWVLLLGGRYDQFHMINNVLHAPATSTDETDSAFTGRAGLVYKAANGLAPYISYTESFEPTSGVDRLGQRFKPSSGTQWEAGLRYQPEDSDTLISAALFNLTRTNVLTPDPLSPTDSVQSGEVRSRGLELELKTRIGRYIDVIGAYTYTNAVVTKSNNPAELGENFNSPKNIFSLWANAKLGFIDLPKWSAGAGVRYVSARPDRQSIQARGGPSYTLFDARLGFESGSWLYALNALNLADKVYIPSMCYAGLCDYGTPRQVTATMTYRW